ncbi:MAG: ADOP family duplicated permease [Vicinamibacterales bacterium]
MSRVVPPGPDDPPRLALRLLERHLDPDAAEVITGDLREEYRQRVRSIGRGAARRWFWRQALLSLAARARRRTTAADTHHPGARKASLMTGTAQDLRFALRLFRRAPLFALTAAFTIAVGVGSATTILTAANWTWLRPLPYRAPAQLVAVGETDRAGGLATAGFLTIQDWRARTRSFESLTPIRGWTPTLAAEDGARRLNGMRVGWDFFRVLGIRPALGRDFEPDDDHPGRWQVVLISDGLWRRRFEARPDVVGSSIEFNGRPYRIIGVLPAAFEPLISERYYSRAEVWAPLGYGPDDRSSCRTCRHLRAIGRLRDGASPGEAEAELATIQAGLRREHPEDYGEANPRVGLLGDQITAAARRPMGVLTGAVAFLLVIACANVAGLLVARSADRLREMVVRAALGAGRGRLVRQLLTESVLLAAAGTVLGLGGARLALRALAASAPAGFARLDQATADPGIWLIAFGVGVLSLLLFGLLPALDAVRGNLEGGLRASRVTGGPRSGRLREGLVVGQVAIALVLVIAGGLMFRTVGRLLAIDPGFDARGVLTAQFSLIGQRWATDEAVYAFQRDLESRVRALPGVDAVGLSGILPLGGNYDRRGFGVEGVTYDSPDDVPSGDRYSVSPGYFAVMGLPLRHGRLIGSEDTPTSMPVALVNETAARTLWPDGSAVGGRIKFGTGSDSPWVTVVGVVGDVQQYDLTSAPLPQFYVPQSQSTDSFLALVIRAPGALDGLADRVRSEVAALATDVPVYGVARLEDLVAASVGPRTFLTRILGAFGAMALLLATVGLYGIVAELVTAREREIGIRLSLGARRGEVARLILARGGVLVAAGLAIGAAGAAVASRLIATQLYDTAPVDPGTYAVAAGVLVTAAIAAHALPLRRATRVDPARVLRGD